MDREASMISPHKLKTNGNGIKEVGTGGDE